MAQNIDPLFDDLLDNSGENSNIGDLNPLDITDNDISIADKDDDSDLFTIDSIEVQEGSDPDSGYQTNLTESETLISELLTAKGIKDNIIKFEDEQGNEEDVNFFDLPKEDQMNILNSSDEDINYGLKDEEINAVNFLREHDVTLEEAIDYYKRQAIQEYIDSQNIAGIEIDQYSDEDLYAIDLKSKYNSLTEEEIGIEIQKQLEHPDLFKKKVEQLRTEYKEAEEAQLQESRLESQKDEELKYTQLQDNLIEVATSVEDIGGLDLDDEDKNEVLSFILEKDINGVSPFLKSLDNPQMIFELAWFATKGKEAFNILHDYYKKQIDEVRKSSYTKGKEEVTGTKTTQQSKSYVRPSTQRQSPTQGKIMNIHDFDKYLE